MTEKSGISDPRGKSEVGNSEPPTPVVSIKNVHLKLDIDAASCKDNTPLCSQGSTTPRNALGGNRLHLTFRDISYSVRSHLLSKERKKILHNICGDFRSGELTVIIGPSGAGKSTMMNILSGYTTSSVTGEVMVNDKKRNLATFRRKSAYIMQDDNIQPLLTVQEAMHAAADLKLNASPRKKTECIDKLLREVGLQGTKNTCSGLLSGGERKRLAIALELINNPQITFFDEPTSGLDVVSSKQCLQYLKSLAREGRTVICTMHQPSATLFEMIDHLYIIADGYCLYTGGSRNLVPFLATCGLQCPTNHNPADYVLEICSGDHAEYLATLVSAIENGGNNFWRSTSMDDTKPIFYKDLGEALPSITENSDCEEPTSPCSYDSHGGDSAYYATGFCRQFCILMHRNALRLSRDRFLTFTRLLMHIIVALILGIIFFQIGEDAKYALDNFNLLYFNMMFLMYSAFSSRIVTFPLELPILNKEHFNRWYKLRSYYLAIKCADLPVQLSAATLFQIIVFFMTGQLPEFKRLLLLIVMYNMVCLVAQNIGLIVGIGLNMQNSVIFGPFAICPFLIFSGFFVHYNDAHPALSWIFHINFLKYGFEGVLLAIYGYDRPKLKCSEIYCHYSSPKTLMNDVGMHNLNYWWSLSALIIIYVFIDVMAFLLLRLRLRTRLSWSF